MSKRGIDLYLIDILQAIKRIDVYTRGLNFEKFAADNKTIDAIIRNFEIVGEAARSLPANYKDKHRAVPWNKMTDMRNKIIHEYFGVDVEILWKTIQEDIPQLKKLLKRLY